MAGNYPDVPGQRMAIDRDGTVGLFYAYGTGVTTQLSPAQMVVIANEDADGLSYGNTASAYWALVFPEKRDIVGFMVGTSHTTDIQVSTNSTNGQDGTWTTIKSAHPSGATVRPDYRTRISATTQNGIKAIRCNGLGYVSGGQELGLTAFHVYGRIAVGENPTRLALWHPTLDSELPGAYFDWGDVPRSSSADRSFRVKNMSPSLTANSITVGQQSLSDTTPSVPGQHLLSTGGGAYSASVTLGNLAPGAVSGVITLRRTTPANAAFGLWAHRVIAEPLSWS